MKKKIALILIVLLTAMIFSAAVSADQNGNDRWCNSDEYGCWVTGDKGEKWYIMFWSEEARAYFMGGKSAPGTLVTRKPDTPGGRFGMEEAPAPHKMTWKELLWDMMNRHRKLLEGQGVDIKKAYKDSVAGFEKNLKDGELTEKGIIDIINNWDDAYNQSEK